MNLNKLKEFLNTLTPQELEGNLIVTSRYTSSAIEEVKRSESNLYWLGDDDPSELIDEAAMKLRVEEEGDDWEDFDEDPYINKGDVLLVTN